MILKFICSTRKTVDPLIKNNTHTSKNNIIPTITNKTTSHHISRHCLSQPADQTPSDCTAAISGGAGATTHHHHLPLRSPTSPALHPHHPATTSSSVGRAWSGAGPPPPRSRSPARRRSGRRTRCRPATPASIAGSTGWSAIALLRPPLSGDSSRGSGCKTWPSVPSGSRAWVAKISDVLPASFSRLGVVYVVPPVESRAGGRSHRWRCRSVWPSKVLGGGGDGAIWWDARGF